MWVAKCEYAQLAQLFKDIMKTVLNTISTNYYCLPSKIDNRGHYFVCPQAISVFSKAAYLQT